MLGEKRSWQCRNYWLIFKFVIYRIHSIEDFSLVFYLKKLVQCYWISKVEQLNRNFIDTSNLRGIQISVNIVEIWLASARNWLIINQNLLSLVDHSSMGSSKSPKLSSYISRRHICTVHNTAIVIQHFFHRPIAI